MTGPGDGLDQVDSKSAFMELQGQGMPPGMGHHAPYPIRSGYPGQHSQVDSVYSSSHMGQAPRAPIGYPFPMSTMSPHGYQPPAHHFNMSPYQTAPTPPTSREGDYSRKYYIIFFLIQVFWSNIFCKEFVIYVERVFLIKSKDLYFKSSSQLCQCNYNVYIVCKYIKMLHTKSHIFKAIRVMNFYTMRKSA